MEVSGKLHTPATLPPKSRLYPLDRRLDRSQSLSGRGDEKKKILAPARNRITVIILTEITWLLFIKIYNYYCETFYL
jgi:hypothetical protein